MIRYYAALAKDLGQTHDGHSPGGDDIGQHLSRPDRRKLVDIADDQQSGPFRDRAHQRPHQHDVDHGGFVDEEQVTVERVVAAALEAPALGVDLQQAGHGNTYDC